MISAPTITIERIRVNGKLITASLFRQLYEEKPFNNDFDLLYEISGKVLQKNEFVVFMTPQGPRKFDISKYKNQSNASSIESNLFSSLHSELLSGELSNIRFAIQQYYRGLADQSDEDSYVAELIYPLLSGKAGYSKLERENSYDSLLHLLTGDFKTVVYNEYQKSLDKIEKRNHLVKTFNECPQVFL